MDLRLLSAVLFFVAGLSFLGIGMASSRSVYIPLGAVFVVLGLANLARLRGR